MHTILHQNVIQPTIFQLQAMLDQKDANYSHKRKLLESQIQLLREQLEAERRKRAKGVVATGPTGGRRTVQHTSAFRVWGLAQNLKKKISKIYYTNALTILACLSFYLVSYPLIFNLIL